MLDALTKIYVAFCDERGFPPMSADELLWDHGDEMTTEQRAWLTAFIALWEATQGLD
jgi:hypothetical protein